ncbi:MAG: baseplate J/gp47 family protein [Bradyrhizobium sp.]|uniref:baseplate J/gp47 family protein n=1 Tax=Bradyrhizobium sp. TaxID=376 RepID=UPI003BEF6054
MFGGLMHEVFGFADYIQKQKFALTADSENLDRHGEELGLARRPRAPAQGVVDISVGAAVSLAVAAVFRRADGVEYIATAGGATTGAGVLSVPVTCAADGQNTNAIAGTPLAIVSGLDGDPAATAQVASGGLVAGADDEDDESFRARILFRKRNPPHGGSAADYVMWTGEVPGVSVTGARPDVFVERLWLGPGSVRVFPLMFDLYANGIPQAADVQRVKDHLETVRPAGARVAVHAAQAVPINITINGLQPNTVAVQEAVLAELRAAFRRNARVAGIDVDIGNMDYLAKPTTFSRSWIWQAVANASGEQRHIIVAPAADQALTPGQMATLGTVTFT